jgi:hypothetical protein
LAGGSVFLEVRPKRFGRERTDSTSKSIFQHSEVAVGLPHRRRSREEGGRQPPLLSDFGATKHDPSKIFEIVISFAVVR